MNCSAAGAVRKDVSSSVPCIRKLCGNEPPGRQAWCTKGHNKCTVKAGSNLWYRSPLAVIFILVFVRDNHALRSGLALLGRPQERRTLGHEAPFVKIAGVPANLRKNHYQQSAAKSICVPKLSSIFQFHQSAPIAGTSRSGIPGACAPSTITGTP